MFVISVCFTDLVSKYNPQVVCCCYICFSISTTTTPSTKFTWRDDISCAIYTPIGKKGLMVCTNETNEYQSWDYCKIMTIEIGILVKLFKPGFRSRPWHTGVYRSLLKIVTTDIIYIHDTFRQFQIVRNKSSYCIRLPMN